MPFGSPLSLRPNPRKEASETGQIAEVEEGATEGDDEGLHEESRAGQTGARCNAESR